jgi:hypothetical protein
MALPDNPDGGEPMRNVRPWTLVGVGLLVAFLTVALVYVAVAQPPAKAPVPVEKRDAEDAKVPPMLGDRDQRLRERAEVMRNTWKDAALLSGRGAAASTIVVEGEHVYVLYGSYLCQLSVDGLKLEAKIDLREALGLIVEREVRGRAREVKEARKARLVEPVEAEEEQEDEAEEAGEE